MGEIKSIKRKINGHGVIVFLSFVLSLSAVAGGAYLYYQALQAKMQLDMKLNDISNQYTSQLNANVVMMQELKQTVVSIQENIAKLTTTTDINKSKLIVYQLNELISMANQALLVYNDVKGTVHLLTYAQTVLNSNSDAGFIALKLAIAKNLEQLNQIILTDNVTLIGRLDAIMSQAQNLPIHKTINNKNNKPQQLLNNNVNNNFNVSELWQKFWVNIKTDFALLIKITTPSALNATSKNKIVLLPADEIIVRQNIKLYLLNARMALLQQDQDGWRVSLTSAAKCFGDYFFMDNSLMSVINSLNDLANVNIAHNSVNLNDTIQALNVTINNIK